MSKVFANLGMSLDGFIAGPDSGPDNPLGDGGMRIHEWVFGVESRRERQSIGGGQTNQDDDIVQENFSRAGAYIMGRQMFAEGEVGWPDPPPFRAPVFVLTHTPREPWVRQGGTTVTFVTEGIDSAPTQAREAAGDKDVQISGGADVVRQFIEVARCWWRPERYSTRCVAPPTGTALDHSLPARPPPRTTTTTATCTPTRGSRTRAVTRLADHAPRCRMA